MNKIIKRLVITGVAISALVSAYFIGFNQNPTYKELPKSVQVSIDKYEEVIKKHLDNSSHALSIGNIDTAIAEYDSSINKLKTIVKIAPEAKQLLKKLSQQIQFLESSRTTNIAINNMEGRLSDIEKALKNNSMDIISYNKLSAAIANLEINVRNLTLIKRGNYDDTLLVSWNQYYEIFKKDLLTKINSWIDFLSKSKSQDFQELIGHLNSIKNSL